MWRKRFRFSFFMTGQPSLLQCLEDRGLEDKIRTFKASKLLSNFRIVDDDTDISVFEGLSLKECLEVKHHVCTTEHHQPCSACSSLIEIGKEISREGYMSLNQAFSVSNPGQHTKVLTQKESLCRFHWLLLGYQTRSVVEKLYT